MIDNNHNHNHNHNEKMRTILQMSEEKIYDCIIIGTGPGGLQAFIYLGRYNRDALLLDRGGGRDNNGFKYKVDQNYESSLSGLYIVGPLNQGNDQVVIAAGEGAVAAIDIKKTALNP